MAKFQIEYELRANLGNLRSQLKGVGNDFDKIDGAVKQSLKGIMALAPRGKAKEFKAFFKEATDAAKQLERTMRAVNAEMNKGAAGNQEKIRKGLQSVRAGILQYQGKAMLGGKEASSKLGEVDPNGSLVRARYALYDIATSARQAGVALTGLGAIAAKTAIDFERAFVDVKRTTTDLNQNGIQELRKSLIDLSSASSLSFVDLSKLATLGNQMGVSGKDIASFTETVAKFSVVTGVTVENASASFGRISELLNVASSEYDNLASSILFAGRNSVATEEEILSLTTQIAASANQAGFAADQTVGLATALASLKIAPEQARGVILRLFGDFDRMIAQNGQSLKDYASLLGTTTDDIRMMWTQRDENGQTRALEFFQKFIAALNSTGTEAGKANVILRNLGIVETREINVLQRLAGNQNVLTESINNARKAYLENTDLADQYGQVSATVAERLKQLQNSIQAVMDSMADSGLMAAFASALDTVAKALGAIASNKMASVFAGLTIAISAGVGVFLLYKAALMQATASLFAFKTAQAELAGQFKLTSLGLVSLIREMGGFNLTARITTLQTKLVATGFVTQANAARIATFAVRGLSFAMKAIPAVLVITTLLEMVGAFKSASERAQELVSSINELDSATKKIKDTELFKDALANASKFQLALTGINNSLVDFAMGGSSKNVISELDNSLQNLVETGEAEKAAGIFAEIKNQATELNMPVEELTKLFPEYSKAVELANKSSGKLAFTTADLNDNSGELSGAIKDVLVGAFVDGANAQTRFSSATLDFVQAIKDSKGSMNEWTTEGSKAKSAFADLISVIAEQAPDMFTALQQTAGAISLIEKAGGDATPEVEKLVEQINSIFGVKIDPTTITSIEGLRRKIESTGDIADSTKSSILALLSGGGFSTALQRAFDNLQSTIKAANAEIRTTKDYASDLASVLSRAFTLRFGKGSAISEFRNAVKDINDGLKSAQQKMADLNSTQNELQTQRIDIQTQIDYANAIGDTQTASDLMTELAKVDAEIAINAEEASYYTERFSGSLDLNTQAGRDNRDALLQVVTSTEDYVTSLAEAGASQAEINKAVQEGRVALQNLGTSLGVSQTDIDSYSKAFNDMGTIIKRTPKDVTIRVTTNSAETALNEFIAYANKQSATIQINAQVADIAKLIEDALNSGRQVALEALRNRAANFKKQRDKYEPGTTQWKMWNQRLSDTKNQITSEAYASGGLVQGEGSGTSDSIPAWLSNGEYVIRASAVKSVGVDFLNAINQQRPVSMPSYGSMSSGANPAQVVYLSASDRELLAAAANRPVTLYTSDRIIADSANRGNRELARRGKN